MLHRHFIEQSRRGQWRQLQRAVADSHRGPRLSAEARDHPVGEMLDAEARAVRAPGPQLPSSVDFVSMSTTAGDCARTGREITCALGQVNAGTTVTVAIVVKAKKQGSTTNTATVTSVDDTDVANNSDTESTVINKKPAAPKKKGKGKGKARPAAPRRRSREPGATTPWSGPRAPT